MQLFAMSFNEFFGWMMLMSIVGVFYARRFLNNNPEVKTAAKSAITSRLISWITKFIK